MAGVDLRTVAELMGHKTIQMTMRYAHLAPQHNLAAVERLVSFKSYSGEPSEGEPADSTRAEPVMLEEPSATTTATAAESEAMVAPASVQ
jgi:hypothetical protein